MRFLVVALFVAGCEAENQAPRPCEGFQYNNSTLELWQIKKYCSDSQHELAVQGREIVCKCKNDER